MVRRFCDMCGTELLKNNSLDDHTLKGKLQRNEKPKNTLNINIQTALNGVWNEGDFCKYCVIDTVKNLDNRPKSV